MGQASEKDGSEQTVDPPFGVSDVVEFLGINAATFQQWMNRGIVPFKTITRGGRSYRRFDLEDVRTIGVVGALHEQGVEPSRAKELAARILPLMDAAWASNETSWTAEEDGLHGETLVEAIRSGSPEGVRRFLEAAASMAPAPEFPPVACVIGEEMGTCKLTDSLGEAIRVCGSAVFTVVDLEQIHHRMSSMRFKALTARMPGLRKIVEMSEERVRGREE
jgi:hypothetical protein